MNTFHFHKKIIEKPQCRCVGGVIAGGILAERDEAIIGGMNDSTISYKDVDSLTLEVAFNDLYNPTEKIEFHTYSKLNMEESDW